MASRSRLKIVDQLSVSSPCPDESFTTNAESIDKGWFCNQCSKEVYDLKKLSRKEIANLIESKNGHFCAVISRRLDGSIITKEPTNPAHSFLSAGILLASTALLNSQAMAQTDVGEIAPQVHNQEAGSTRGDVYVPPSNEHANSSETSSAASVCSEHSNNSSEAAIVRPDPNIITQAGGISVQVTKGKVRVEPKK